MKRQSKSEVKKIVKVLDDVIPEIARSISYSKQDISKMSIGLPAKARDLFPKVFDALEDRRRELGITTINVGISMEDVFLRYDPYLHKEYPCLAVGRLEKAFVRVLIPLFHFQVRRRR